MKILTQAVCFFAYTESDGTVRVSSRHLDYETFEKLSHGALQSVVVVATDPGGYTTSSQLNIQVGVILSISSNVKLSVNPCNNCYYL